MKFRKTDKQVQVGRRGNRLLIHDEGRGWNDLLVRVGRPIDRLSRLYVHTVTASHHPSGFSRLLILVGYDRRGPAMKPTAARHDAVHDLSPVPHTRLSLGSVLCVGIEGTLGVMLGLLSHPLGSRSPPTNSRQGKR